ncbi:MAG: hypothetical protein PHD43_05715 [Methylococcales bacterium]|nr:hypothetical protein [Methylococcales bacterium]
MNKNNLTRGAFAALLLASTVAGADQQYPAADFQPEVIYQDSDYIAKNSPSTPANKTSKAASSAAEGSVVDSKYPAANFQPEVLYHDPNYKPSASVKETVSKEIFGEKSEEISSKQVVDSSESPVMEEVLGSKQGESQRVTAVSKEKSSMLTYLIGLVILAAAGFYFFKKQTTTTVKKEAPLPARTSYTLTGVSKYLNKVSGTGVSRYLEKHVKSPTATTGVAKYMAKKAVSAPTTAAKAATGVEKYMRDRG